MAKITLDVPDELSERLLQLGERLPEFLGLSLEQPPLPARVYRYVLEFLAARPTPEQIANFRPTPEMAERLQTLLARSEAGTPTPTERIELDEYDRIEHLIVMLQAGNLPHLMGDGE